MGLIKKSIISFVLLFSIIAMVGCGEQRVSEDTDNLNKSKVPEKSNVSEEVIQEKIISLPEKIGVAESLIMFHATDAGEPQIYTIGENADRYYYMKYTFRDGDWLSEEAEFQDECNKKNSKMIVQRVFENNDFLYLVNALILDAKKNTYELSLYRYNKKKNKLKKVEFERLSYEDKDTKTKYDVFDLQFIDDQNFVAAYNSGMFVRYNILEKKYYKYEQPLFGNFCVFDNRLYTSDMAKKKVLGFNLDSSCVDEEIQLDLQSYGYNFCTYDEEIYVGCKNGIFALNGTEAQKLIDGKVFSTYVIDEKSKVIALCRDDENFYMLFAQGNAYKLYSYAIIE